MTCVICVSLFCLLLSGWCVDWTRRPVCPRGLPTHTHRKLHSYNSCCWRPYGRTEPPYGSRADASSNTHHIRYFPTVKHTKVSFFLGQRQTVKCCMRAFSETFLLPVRGSPDPNWSWSRPCLQVYCSFPLPHSMTLLLLCCGWCIQVVFVLLIYSLT